MPTILRLCLHAVDREAAGGRMQLWLSLSVGRATTPKTVIHSARTMIEERMAAHLEASEDQMALCVRDAKDRFIFLGTATMAAADVHVAQMPFFVHFLHAEQRRLQAQHRQQGKKEWNKFVFVQGVLLPLAELRRVNSADSSSESPSVSLYAVVNIPEALRCEPVDAAESEKDPHAVSVYYVDFSGRKFVATVPGATDENGQHTDMRLCDLMRAVCESIGAQTKCVFNPSNMILMCRVSRDVAHPIETDAALRIALTESGAHLFITTNLELLATSSPPRVAPPEQPQLMLQEEKAKEEDEDRDKETHLARNDESEAVSTRDKETHLARNDESEAVSTGASSVRRIDESTDARDPSDVRLASSTATLCQLAAVDPTPSFMPCDRDSVLRMRTFNTPASANAVEEEDAARLRLAASHARLDEAYNQYRLETERGGKHDTEMDELLRRKTVLLEEWTECLSAERDCERLQTLINWLEKDLAEGHTRQEQLLRAIYGS